MNAIGKTLAGQSGASAAASECMPLDDYVQAAWSFAGSRAGKADERFNAPASGRPQPADSHPEMQAPRFVLRALSALAPRDAIAPGLESDAQTSALPHGSRTKEALDDDACVSASAACSAPLPPRQPELSWRPQRGIAAPAAAKNATTNTISAVNTTGIAAATSTISKAGAARVHASSAPIAAAQSSFQPVPRSSSQSSSRSASHSVFRPEPKSEPGTAQKPESKPAAVNPAAAIGTAAGFAHAQPVSVQAEVQASTASDSTAPASASAPDSASASALPHKEKTHPQTAEPALPAAPLQLTAGLPLAAPGGGGAQPDRAKPQPQPQPPAVAPVQTDSPASGGASLTYRFDKWGGDHAVTVRTASQDLRQSATATVTVAPASASVTPDAASTMPAAPQQAAQPPAQYTLSPSDPLVGQRLGEHLAQFGHVAGMPALHLKDTDEQSKRQQQAPREDDEEDA